MPYSLEAVNLLVVEDDRFMRMLLRDLLNSIGVKTIQTATDGVHAYSILRHYPADIAIVDWVMQPMDGIEFLDKVRNGADSPNAFLPIIMLTAHTQIERVEESRDHGVTSFLSKPVTPKTLYGRIANVIEDKRRFVRSDSYFGPDRRHLDRPFPGLDRRQPDSVVDLD